LYLELLKLASPEAVLTGTVLVLLALQAIRPGTQPLLPFVAALGVALSGLAVLLLPDTGNISDGMLVVSPLSSLAKLICLGLTLFTVLFTHGSTFTKHLGEYLALILLATIGLLILVSTDQLLMIFIGLELTGLSLYIISAFDKASRPGIEGGMKYFLFGSVASAFTLFGLSLIFGMTGSTHLPRIALVLSFSTTQPLLLAGIVMTLVGLAFKVAAAPMHLWAPDTYQAAPVPSAAFIASASKVAAFFVLGRLLLTGLAPVAGSADYHAAAAGWTPVLAVLAALSIITGNLVALAQNNLRRLLAYSAIAHAGYALLGLLAGTPEGFAATLFYTAVYGVTILGTFAIIDIVRRQTGSDDIADFANLRHRSPVLAAILTVFMLSLAGLPPLVGFFGKFYLFAAAYAAGENHGLLWIIILALAGSLVSLYYYLSVLKTALVDTAEDAPTTPLRVPALHQILLAILAALTLGLGLFPNALLDAIGGTM
jgi:NADH-quinone oxidoreductase subunit N